MLSICLFRLEEWWKFLPHCMQIISLCSFVTWFCRDTLSVTIKVQFFCKHLYMIPTSLDLNKYSLLSSFVLQRLCWDNLLLSANPLPHTVHLKSFSFLWITLIWYWGKYHTFNFLDLHVLSVYVFLKNVYHKNFYHKYRKVFWWLCYVVEECVFWDYPLC